MADNNPAPSAAHTAAHNLTPSKLNRPIAWLDEKPSSGYVFGVAIFLVCTVLTFVIVVDCNRYWGYCPKREFHDSIGPPPHEGDRISCREENESRRAITPGRLPGHIFTSRERSLPAWIAIGLFSCITSVINFALICNHPKNRRSENAECRSFSHHQSEHGRVSWIIYVCTAVIIVHQVINMAKVADCRPENGAEIFYTLMIGIDVSMQGKC